MSPVKAHKGAVTKLLFPAPEEEIIRTLGSQKWRQHFTLGITGLAGQGPRKGLLPEGQSL